MNAINTPRRRPYYPTTWRTAALVILALSLVGCGNTDSTQGLPGEGTWRVINYWAIWCTPCRTEIPELNSLNQLPDITVLGVNYDGKTGEALAEHITEMAIAFTVLEEDPSTTLNSGWPRVLPTTLLVDPEGRHQHSLVGPQTRDDILAALAELGRRAAVPES